MNQFNKITVVLGLLACSSVSYAGTVVADGRGNGMGNTGVTSADYVLAPFYNPALTAIHRDSDDFGLLVPAVGATLRDTDKSLDTIDDLQDSIDKYNAGNVSELGKIDQYLDELSDNKSTAVTAGAGLAVAFPLNTLSANFFARGFAEIVADPKIDDNADPEQRYQNSKVKMIAFGYYEYGVALAKQVSIVGQDVSLGITPKYQELRTYKQSLSVEDFDLDDYDNSETNKNTFNLDLGAVWLVENYRLGVVVKDLFSKQIDTQNIGGVSRYKLNTQMTLSGTYMNEFFAATMDIDVTKQERFSELEDETQFVRVGVEGNAFGWAQLRAGYQTDVQDTLDDEVTVGIGISPGDLVSIDVAGSYAGDNQFGISGNLSFTF
ncbi:MAG: conjugal transfer protein TraF [Pseudomonadota bacterium]